MLGRGLLDQWLPMECCACFSVHVNACMCVFTSTLTGRLGHYIISSLRAHQWVQDGDCLMQRHRWHTKSCLVLFVFHTIIKNISIEQKYENNCPKAKITKLTDGTNCAINQFFVSFNKTIMSCSMVLQMS